LFKTSNWWCVRLGERIISPDETSAPTGWPALPKKSPFTARRQFTARHIALVRWRCDRVPSCPLARRACSRTGAPGAMRATLITIGIFDRRTNVSCTTPGASCCEAALNPAGARLRAVAARTGATVPNSSALLNRTEKDVRANERKNSLNNPRRIGARINRVARD
jgi:hypothetical protein